MKKRKKGKEKQKVVWGWWEREMVSPSVSVTLNPTGLGYSLCFLAPVVNGSETDLFRSGQIFLFCFFFALFSLMA